MDELTFIFKSWKTCLEIAQDRGYILDDAYSDIQIPDFKHMLSNNSSNIDIICNNNVHNSSSVLYIKFILGSRIKPSTIKEIYDDICENKNESEEIELIIVLKGKPNNSILKLQKEKAYSNIQIFWCKQLQFNVTKHEFVPTHRKLSNEEADNILKLYSIVNKFQLPILLRDDIVSKYYNYKHGDIIEITNTLTSQNSNYKFYRCVR